MHQIKIQQKVAAFTLSPDRLHALVHELDSSAVLFKACIARGPVGSAAAPGVEQVVWTKAITVSGCQGGDHFGLAVDVDEMKLVVEVGEEVGGLRGGGGEKVVDKSAGYLIAALANA